jgi:hypothetical protein
MFKTLSARLFAPGILALGVLFGAPETAQAEEIKLTGPLAGAPAVRNMRLYRQGRVELSPNVSFTLLDEYRRQIIFGLRANYGVFDWLSVGVWGGVSTSLLGAHIDTDLTSDIQGVNAGRQCRGDSAPVQGDPGFIDCELTGVNLGSDFRNQVASLDWILAPQLTAVPFRGKLGLFNSLFVDSELYVFAGPAFVGLRQRPDCSEGSCTALSTFTTSATMAIAPTFGLGFSFFFNKWMAIGTEYRALPFAWNTGGFDVAGRGPSEQFPDGAISSADSQFKFNHLLSVSFNMYLPMDYKVTE